MDYKKAYAMLVGTMSNVVDEIGKARVSAPEIDNAVRLLIQGLEQVEEMYLCVGED